MKSIFLDDFKIIPIVESAKRLKISDEEYFSEKYSDYISNSRLGNIDPSSGGSWKKFLHPPKFSTNSLVLGSAIHELILQPESFQLFEKCCKPTAKLGLTIDKVKLYRKEGNTIKDSILKACEACDYYAASAKGRIHSIIEAGYKYYLKTRHLDDSHITLDDSAWETCNKCVNSVQLNEDIIEALTPTGATSFNEDALFLDIVVTYKSKAITLKLKAKADNWTLDEKDKILTLNDLKTTSKPNPWFMKDYGSFYKYHYYRQFYMYLYMLQYYCMAEYGWTKKWTTNCNVLVVNTEDFKSKLFKVYDYQLSNGKAEFERFIKMVAYYSLFGDNDKEKLTFI